jgi:hypothetical protein
MQYTQSKDNFILQTKPTTRFVVFQMNNHLKYYETCLGKGYI